MSLIYSVFVSVSGLKHVGNDFQKAVLLWMYDPPTRDATIVRKELSGSVICLKAATEVICSRTSAQIQHFKQIYYTMFGVLLESDIEFHASGDLKKVSSLFLDQVLWHIVV